MANYIEKIAIEIYKLAEPQSDGIPADEYPLYRLYAVLALAKGRFTTMEDVHNAWAAWALDHRSQSVWIIPFSDLPLHIQEMNDLYRDAIRVVAQTLYI